MHLGLFRFFFDLLPAVLILATCDHVMMLFPLAVPEAIKRTEKEQLQNHCPSNPGCYITHRIHGAGIYVNIWIHLGYIDGKCYHI